MGETIKLRAQGLRCDMVDSKQQQGRRRQAYHSVSSRIIARQYVLHTCVTLQVSRESE